MAHADLTPTHNRGMINNLLNRATVFTHFFSFPILLPQNRFQIKKSDELSDS